MRYRKVFLSLLGAVLLGLNLLGCSGEKVGDTSLSKGEETSLMMTGPEEKGVSEVGKISVMSVKIIPEVPRVVDELQAIITGGGRVNYRWERNGKVVDGEGKSRLKQGFSKGDTITVRVATEDGEATDSVVIGNTPPAVTGVTLTPEFIYRGVDITAEVKATDPDGADIRLSYQWFKNGERIPGEIEPILEGDRFKRGDKISFQVTPFDGEEKGKAFSGFPITIPNASPLFISTPPLSFKSSTYTYQSRAEDPDGDPVTYSFSEAPQGMVVNPETGEVEWRITEEGKGKHIVEIVAEDGESGRGFQRYTLTITF